MELQEYLKLIRERERIDDMRWWRRMVPFESVSQLNIAPPTMHPASHIDTANKSAVNRHCAAYFRVKRNLPECLMTFNLICRNGNNRKESICKIHKAMLKRNTTATARS